MGWDNNKYPSNWNSIRKRILKRDGYNCTECGTSDDQLHVHHIKPISEGGSHSPKNLRTLCHSCHENVHGHRIPTKGESYNSSASLWKKAVWLPSWDSANTNTDDIEFKKIEETFIQPLRRENSPSKSEWIARQAGALSMLFVIISPWIWIAQDMLTFEGEIFPTIIASLLVYLILMLVPIISIPIIFIGIVAGIVVWSISKYVLQKYYENNI